MPISPVSLTLAGHAAGQQHAHPDKHDKHGRQQSPAAQAGGDADIRFNAHRQFLELFHHAVMDPLSCALDLPLLDKDPLAQLGQESGPAATAERIVRDFYRLYTLYRQQHPNQSPMQQRFIFLAVARQSLDCGFNEAHQMLETLGLLHQAYHELVSAKEQVAVSLIAFGQTSV